MADCGVCGYEALHFGRPGLKKSAYGQRSDCSLRKDLLRKRVSFLVLKGRERKQARYSSQIEGMGLISFYMCCLIQSG